MSLPKLLSHKLIFSQYKIQAFPPDFLARKFSTNWQFPQIFGRIAHAETICLQRITTKLGGNACIVWVVCLIKYFWASKRPAGIYLLKVNIGSIRTRCEICSKLTIKTPEQWQRCCFCVLIDNFEHVSHLALLFLLLNLNR